MKKYRIKFFEDKYSTEVIDYEIHFDFTIAFDIFRECCEDYMGNPEEFYYPRFYEVNEVEKYEVWGDFR